jgi:hypothetical protein
MVAVQIFTGVIYSLQYTVLIFISVCQRTVKEKGKIILMIISAYVFLVGGGNTNNYELDGSKQYPDLICLNFVMTYYLDHLIADFNP